MATDFFHHLDRTWTLGQAVDTAKFLGLDYVEFESDDTVFVVVGATVDPGEAPSRYSPGSPACVDWEEGSGIYVRGEIAGHEALFRLSDGGWKLFDKEHENKLIALLCSAAKDAAEDRAAEAAGLDGFTSDSWRGQSINAGLTEKEENPY